MNGLDEIKETWHINNQINLYLLNGIEQAHMNDTASSKGRTVGDQFGHINNVRLMWLKESEPELMDTVIRLEKGTTDKKIIIEAFKKSAHAMAQRIQTSPNSISRIYNWA